MPIDYSAIPMDLFMAGSEAFVKTENAGGSKFFPIYPLGGKNNRMVVRFLTDGWDEAQNDGHDWFVFREVWTTDGLRSGHEMPQGLQTFPVFDMKVVEDSVTGKRGLTYGPKGTDPYLDLVNPSKKFPAMRQDGSVIPYAKPATQMIINVINEEGEHIILKLTKPKAEELVEYFKNQAVQADVDGREFTAIRGAYELTLTGKAPQTKLNVKPLKSEPIELPEPYDLKDIIHTLRKRAESFIDNALGLGSSDEGTVQEDVIVDDYETVTPTDSYEEAVQIAEAITPSADKYQHMSAVRIKRLLADAGVPIPARATPDMLREIAANTL
ncbi:hypothetical protein UFOVP1264_41 [uncultured Caudovirales phage]|uniref:Uncharacterized protein n=1 Tax=uncultured Caudovirales phage TaxID=2100421 RepID=A0A6J5RJS7_9CAUD|nr:hypothetical protein UFOVP1264_41 [uncultured Caudovirales phage]